MIQDYKILYVSYTRSGRGDEVHTRQFMAALEALHPRVVFHTPRLAENIHALKQRRGTKAHGGADPLRELRYIGGVLLKRVREQWIVLRREQPDVVIMRSCRYLSLVWLCRLLRIPIVLEVNAPMWERNLHPTGERFRPMTFWCWLEARLFALADRVNVVSQPLNDYYYRYGLAPNRLTVVANGVDICSFSPTRSGSAVRTRFNLEDKIVIGFIGSFAPWHGLDFLLRSLDRWAVDNPDQKDRMALLLVGHQTRQFRLPDVPGVPTVMIGKVPFEQVPDFMAAMDIITAPYPPIEPFYFSPLKVLEGMAMGKPVIASDQGQISELITHGYNGILYPAGDQWGFLNQLQRLIEDGELRSALGANARHIIEKNFTWHINAKRVLEVCNRLIRQKYNRY
ncbi:glycosyl transferase family 1 [Desulfosarcina ovata subsp. ovata]|uniref:Glycosyl transferase family 1 n=1 Tax=Desulfosarcina ovata subsp. ovata TaxID=2752305 RepID=A0A5K8A5Q2_9BACT|nr:glycosyl transferase family 1 [Desulfosarcina ovata subsp. ovata]